MNLTEETMFKYLFSEKKVIFSFDRTMKKKSF